MTDRPLRLAVLLLVVGSLLALIPKVAAADPYSWDGAHGHYAGERDASSNPVVARAVAAGQGWWSKQGVFVCGPPQGLTVRMAVDLDDAWGRALGCDVWVNSEVVDYANSLGWSPVAVLCNVVWHELAHTWPASMTHEQMAPYEDAKRAGCRRFADRVVSDARRLARLHRALRAAGGR